MPYPTSLWPRHPGCLSLPSFLRDAGAAQALPWALSLERDGDGPTLTATARAVVEALQTVNVHTVQDLVRCDWTPLTHVDGSVGQGVWHTATNAFLLSGAFARCQSDLHTETDLQVHEAAINNNKASGANDRASALALFWTRLEQVYRLALDVCAAERSVLDMVAPTLSPQARDTSPSVRDVGHVVRNTLSLPRDVAQYLASTIDLADRCEVVQVAGTQGSGRRTLVLNSILRSLWLHEDEKALWLCIPWATYQEDTLTAAHDVRQHVAKKSVQIQLALRGLFASRHLGKRKRKRPNDSGSDPDEHDSTIPTAEEYLSSHDPVQRLFIHSASTIEEVEDTLDRAYPSRRQQDEKGPHKETKRPPEILVLDAVNRLFLDPDGQPCQRVGDTSLPTRVQRLLYTLVQLSRQHRIRSYVLNGAVSGPSSFAPVFPTSLVPALGGAVEASVDGTLWLTGDTVFPLGDDDDTQPGDGCDGPTDPVHHLRKKLGVRPRVVEVHSLSGPHGRWGVYSSDGLVLYD